MAKRRGAKRRVQRFQIEWYGEEFVEILREHGPEALFEAARVVMAEASRRAPRKTGKLAGSGYIGVKGKSTYTKRRFWRREKFARDGEAVIGFSAPHAHLMESGRRRRGEIRPRKKRAIVIDGKFVSRSKYNRMHSRPFLGPALEASRELVPREIAKVYGSWLDKLLGGRP
jgi:hypothetical protein